MSNKYLSFVIKLMIAMIWLPTLAFAGVVVTSTPDPLVLLNVPVVVVVVNIVFATLAGATTLAIRINTQLTSTPNQALPNPGLFCLAHMMGSWLAGIFMFLITQAQQTGLWMGFGLVLLASFSGAKFLEKAVEKLLPMSGPAA